MSHLCSPEKENFFVCFFETVFLCACPGTRSIDHSGLKVTEIFLPLPPKGLMVCTTTPSFEKEKLRRIKIMAIHDYTVVIVRKQFSHGGLEKFLP